MSGSNTDAVSQTLATLWANAGVTEADIGEWTAGTLHASSRTKLLTDDTMLASGGMPSDALATSPEQLTMGEALGRGGMGLVRLARQGSLRREVAVKTVHDPSDARSRNALLKEAWVGGTLEHPNVVPVHTLATDEGGPAMVMKRVEGRSFLEELEDADTGHSATLERHLRVVIAVSHAIAFAHERGILHLDLKPENVMLGEFGEVYVVDWGLAVGFGDAAPGWIQPASAISGVAGTPGYMAPELVAADGDSVGPRTDVYLLGGMLYTVLTGEPLHSGGNLMHLLMNAWTSEPKALPGVPEELAGIVRCATARERDARFESVDALREALEDFLRHRLADRLAGVAATLHDTLRERLGGEPVSDVEIEPQLAELEQALLQARVAWPAHPKLDRLAEGLLELRAIHALSHRRADATEIFLSRMARRPPNRERELMQLRMELEASKTRLGQLESIGRELDLALGGGARRWLFGISSVFWLGISLALGWATRSGVHRVGYPELLVEGLLVTAVLIPVGWLGRDRFFQSRVNRRLYGGLLLTVVTVQAHWAACAAMGIPVMTSVAITAIYYSYAFGTLAFVIDRRLLGGAIAMGLTAVAALFEPSWSYDLLGLGGFVACLWTLWMWRRGDDGSAK
ncbi:MAG: protein kinase [Sandaracinaceae bacterium]